MNIIRLQSIIDDAQIITTQHAAALPFRIKRVFIIRSIASKTIRGKHAHKKNKQALFCIQGSMKIRLDNGIRKREYLLSSPDRGVFIDRMVWSEMYDFSRDAICIVFASQYFTAKDYIRDYKEFRKHLA